MKKVVITGLAFAFLSLASCNSGTSGTSGEASSSAEFYVRGNCSMCQERIETTLKATKGVTAASWDVSTKMVKVSYDSTQVQVAGLEQAVAKSGHETKTVPSPAEVHDALPECCKKGSSM
ncbi:MAG: heavy-metal-associated domain-containing protein [Cytophagaceae bacterium]|jgi:copper chaperone CopZ|nr:heavy-metal-associated domain-containing protein [Cytophagaceae bacterium]